MPRYWLDTEFIEDGKAIDLISIGMVCEDGREYYAQSVEFDTHKASEWVKDNVLSHLLMCTSAEPSTKGISGLYHTDRAYHKKYGQCTFENPAKDVVGPSGAKLPQLLLRADCPWRTREQIANEIVAFCDPEKYGRPEFWGYYSAYDHVALAQLYGPMIDFPPQWPMYTCDIKQWCDHLGNPELPEQGNGEHNALQDARWNKTAWEFLRDLKRPTSLKNMAQ